MGVDLKLLIVEADCGSWGYAHTMLEIGRDYEFHDALRQKHPKPHEEFSLSSFVSVVPDGKMKGEYCYGKVEETPYGEPLTFLSIKEVLEAWNSFDNSASNLQQQAAMAYLGKLEATKQIALFWH